MPSSSCSFSISWKALLPLLRVKEKKVCIRSAKGRDTTDRSLVDQSTLEKVSRYPVDSPVAPPRTSVPRNHPFCLETGLVDDAISVPIFPVIDGDDLKKEAASEEDNTARTAAAVVNLIAIELLKLELDELL